MKKLYLILVMIQGILAYGQWTNDQEFPLAICDAPGQQRYQQVVADGNGGWFIFWLDQRAQFQVNTVYGQHVDEDGNAQWTENGILILDYPLGSISDMKACRLQDGDLLLFYSAGSQGAGANSLRAMKINEQGVHLWSSPVLVAEISGFTLSYSTLRMIPSSEGALLAYRAVITGGTEVTFVNKIEADGTLAFGTDGRTLTSGSYGSLMMISDGQEGAIILWKNAASASGMGVIRVDSAAEDVWASPVLPLQASGLAAGTFDAAPDGQGGVAVCFSVSNNTGIQFFRLDGDGVHMLSPEIKPANTFNSVQDRPRILAYEGSFTVVWQDNRPPANFNDLFIQRLDSFGNQLWDEAGMPAILTQTYVPYTAIIPCDSGSVIVTQLTTLEGIWAQRIREDGSRAWAEEAALTTSNVTPFYEEYNLVPDGNGGGTLFWYNDNSQNIYGAHVDFFGTVGIATELNDHELDAGIKVWPNPSDGVYNISITGYAGAINISVYNELGQVVYERQLNYSAPIEIDVQGSPGLYVMRVQSSDGAIVSRRLMQID